MTISLVRFNSLAPRGANHRCRDFVEKHSLVSTHSPRGGRTSGSPFELFSFCEFQLTRPAGGEPIQRGKSKESRNVSTHSPRGGRTDYKAHRYILTDSFNSLAPRGANRATQGRFRTSCRVSTHSPRGGRTGRPIQDRATRTRFNSLAPRGANLRSYSSYFCDLKFQLTRPAGGEPSFLQFLLLRPQVSTHSPRGGRTRRFYQPGRRRAGFNSLAPRGANQIIASPIVANIEFQLTRPAGGEPRSVFALVKFCNVSTHSPRGGRTRQDG